MCFMKIIITVDVSNISSADLNVLKREAERAVETMIVHDSSYHIESEDWICKGINSEIEE